jgi:hypothetical protein
MMWCLTEQKEDFTLPEYLSTIAMIEIHADDKVKRNKPVRFQ